MRKVTLRKVTLSKVSLRKTFLSIAIILLSVTSCFVIRQGSEKVIAKVEYEFLGC